MSNNKALRQHLLNLLKGGDAHVGFESAIKNFPANLRGKRPKGAGHSAWEVLEHLRIAQWDILESPATPVTDRLNSQAGTGLALNRLRAKKPGTRVCKPFARILRRYANWWPMNRPICWLSFHTATVRLS